MNSKEFDKKYREFKVSDDLHDDIKYYISDEKLNNYMHTLSDENKELKNKCTNQKITTVGVLNNIEEQLKAVNFYVNTLLSFDIKIIDDEELLNIIGYNDNLINYIEKVKIGDKDE